ncbi:MAG TPA: LuxR C-terminal-related transcriptional regulator [Ilumatobacteraceae bacterium]|nr:LuxR C-terminal-related transcriptional regulator [Ilumatobacteraceae bacterium]
MNASYIRPVEPGSISNLAATKLRPPGPPTRLVDRARLGSVLDAAAAAEVALVLVSAPAGSGKSTLVAGWVAAHQGPVAWLQLEESDADPARYWVSFTAAISRANPEIGARLEPLVTGSYGAGQVVVPALVNEAASMTQRLVVVLDDYHLVDDAEVHGAMERLIDLCPAQLTLMLITRADPPFRLGRMRVRGRVREIRAGDLRFEHSEAAALLGSVAATLDDRQLDDLCERTEGWAAGLVLAGLSLEHTDDTDHFVETFRGDDQLVAGYLTDELLAVLDDDERGRMIEAAVLHRLSGPLLDAVTGSTDGARWLERLAARNQLVIRLDTVGEWYRYHHLFRDLLLLEARRSIPDRIPDLHRRAAAWFETSGYPAAAVDHLLAAGDREHAMLLMRLVGPDLLGSGQLKTLRNILGRLSDGGELDAICLTLSGWDQYLSGRYDEAQHLLDRATATLPADVDPMRTMPLRINLALGKGDVSTALAGARAVVTAGDVDARPSELTTATGAAFAWAGLAEEARAALAIAHVRTLAEKRTTAHAMSLVAAAVVEYHSTGHEAAGAAAERAVDFASSSGLGGYHGIAPAIAIRAATGSPGAAAITDAERAVALARRATTRLGLLFVLILAGDVLLSEGADRGHELLDEARHVIDTCPDPGITLPMLDRVTARHRIARPRPIPTAGLVEQLSERELAVLRYLPSTLSLPEIARELYVSPNTVKTQCSAIYRKLAVTNRKAAVQTAREHRLL